jgi:hypothetical protein
MRAIAVCGALLAAPALAEEPPLWAYLAECSAVFAAAAQSDGYVGATGDEVALVTRAAEAYLAHAVAAAGEAGQADPEADVASIMTYLTPRWENRIDRFLSVKSNLDWIDYCRRLGIDRGIVPLPKSP